MKYCNCNLIQNKNRSSAWETLIKTFFLFVLVTINMDAIAQNDYVLSKDYSISGNEKFYKTISFGDKIFFGKVENTTTWIITNTAEKVKANVRGNEINQYVFDKTGEYEIRFSENKKHSDECNHPPFDERMLVKVNPVKMAFDFSKIVFSEYIQKSRNYDDLIITVPVAISTIDNSIKRLAAPGLFIAGVGVAMKAKPINETIEIKNGIQVLKYRVTGIVNTESYLMFDFSDFNNQIHTYNLPQIIN